MTYVDASKGTLGTIYGAREAGAVVGQQDGCLLVYWMGSDCPWPARVPLARVTDLGNGRWQRKDS